MRKPGKSLPGDVLGYMQIQKCFNLSNVVKQKSVKKRCGHLNVGTLQTRSARRQPSKFQKVVPNLDQLPDGVKGCEFILQ